VATRSGRSTPPALVVSVVFGCVGLVLLLAGLVGDNRPLLVAGVASAAVSLIAALVWREQLIEAWHARKDQADDQ
jgi:hypothetical protein